MNPLLRSVLPPRPIARALTLALVLDTSAGSAPAAHAVGGPRVVAHARATRRAGARAPVADSVVGFALRDQFGRVHDAAAYRGRALLVVGAGHGGRAAGTAWIQTLRGLQGDSAGAAVLPVVAVADLRGVPRLLRRVVRGRFPDDPRQAVLLDWDGALARRFGFDPERCTILLVGPTGRPHAQTSAVGVDTVLARALLRDATALMPAAVSGPPR